MQTKDTKFTKALRFYFVIFVIFVASLFVPSWPRLSRTSHYFTGSQNQEPERPRRSRLLLPG